MNLAQLLEGALRDFTAQSVTNVIVWVLLVGFVIAILLGRRAKFPLLVQHTPNLLTSIGILGTFIGIVIGLLGFNTGDIDGSIGPLLDGLKTAFITSLVGMALSVIFKLFDSAGLITQPESEDIPEAVTPEQIMGSMVRQEAAMAQLVKSIAGDEESALISQIRLLRSDQSDQSAALLKGVGEQEAAFEEFQERLWREMSGVAEMLSKSATEQVIEALNQVIKDFNENLTEQFGDNFKRLDESVQKLVVWQDQYKEQLQQMQAQYAESVKMIGHSRDLVAAIQADTQKIPETMESLRELLETTRHQLAELERHLHAFKDMRDRAVEAVPEIRGQIETIVNDVSSAAQDSSNRISSVTEKMQETLITGFEDFQNNVSRTNEGLTTASNALANKSDEISDQLTESVKEVNERMRDLMAMMEKGYQDIEAEITRAASHSADALNSKLSEAVDQTAEAVTQQVNAINQAMEKEIESVMSSMGKSLAQISEKFTGDYSQLTRQMKTVVNQASRFDE